MDNITLQALQTFQKNLTFFETHHKVVFDKIVLLNHLIDEGTYTEKYALEYRDNSYFDIQDLKTNEWFYGENSQDHSKNTVNMTNLKRTGGVFQALRFVDFSSEMPDIIDQSTLHFHNALWATIKVIEYHRTHIAKTDNMKTAFKTIFISTGLGLHIAPLIDKLHTKLVFITEKDLEIFRLSLFVTAYSEIATSTTIIFSIMEDEFTERKSFINFLETGNNYNLYIKHIPLIKEYEPILQRFQSHVLSQSFIMYGYSAMLLRYIDSPKYLAKDYSFLNISKRYDNSWFSNKPVLFLFSGPSTGKNIEWIQSNKNRFIIVTALSTCRLLHKFDIKPDIIIHIDPGVDETALLFEGMNQEFYNDCIAIFASSVDEKTVSRFQKNKIHFVDQDGVFKKDFGNLTAPSVGEYTYALFLVFGAKEIYLLGLDLALDAKTFNTHSELHPFSSKGALANDEDTSFDYTKRIEYVQGNLSQQVPTLALYKLSIGEFARFTLLLKQQEQHIYNLGDGAYLNGTKPTAIDTVSIQNYSILNKNSTKEELIIFFNSIASKKFRKEDKRTIKKELEEAKKLVRIIKVHQKNSYLSSSQYLDAIALLARDLSDMEYQTNSCLAQVYYEYFQIVLSYIFDLFNTEDTENSNKHITQIETILVKQLLKMSTLYITKLEGYLK